MRRRDILAAASAGGLCGCLPGLAAAATPPPGLALPGLALPGLALPGLALPGLALPGLALPGLALRDRAARRGLSFGSMVQSDYLAADPAYAAAVVRDCAIVVPGVEAKWWATEPQPGVFDFAKFDAIAAFARQNGLRLRGHNLLWSVWNPPWLAPAMAAGGAQAILERHIAAVAGRHAGQVAAWDVLNEVADPRWPSGPDGLCRTLWWHALGPGYVDIAFHAAHRADPAALLFANDDWLEYPQCAAKRALYLRLVEAWLRRGVPIHGFGIEAHLRPDLPFDAKEYRKFLAGLAGMGLVIHVTELDVIDRTLPADTSRRDRMVADTVARYLDVALDETAVRAVLVWGLADPYSDLDSAAEARRPDGLPARGAPLDRAFRPKPFFQALANAFDHAPQR